MDVFKKVEQRKQEAAKLPYRLQYGVAEAALLLGVSERTVATMIKSNEIESYKLRGRRFIQREVLIQFVNGLGA